MKKILSKTKCGLLASIIMLAASGCSGFLDADTPSIITDEYYNTKAGQEKLLVDINEKYRGVFNTAEIQYFGTDLYMAITESPVEKMFNGYDKTFNSTAPVVKDYWKNLYKIVQESNILLNRCTPSVAGNDYDSFTVQARFFRAMAYYYLVETFGPIPFYTEENKSVISSATRTDEKTIYAFIIQELEESKGLLNMTNNQAGRVTDAAVIQLLGKLYLTRAYRNYAETTDFAKASECFDALITDGNYRLLDKYASVYDENNQNNAEVIWAIQYGTDKMYVGGGNNQHKRFGYNITALDPDMFDKVQTDYSSMGREYWVIPKVHELFTNPVIDTRYDVTFKRHYYVNQEFLSSNKPNPNFGKLGIYFPRWNDNSGINDGAIKYYPFKTGNAYNWYPQYAGLPVLVNGIDKMPIINKFKDSKIDWGAAGSREDVVFRLSDTYLLSAEAHLGAGNSGLALERVNAIRKRAATDDASFDQSMKLNTVDINVILDERARELLGDHDRWFDLKRTGTLIERAKANNPYVSAYNNINKNHLIRPIPQDEINKLDGLTQNEGY